jgi:hypothetical protein
MEDYKKDLGKLKIKIGELKQILKKKKENSKDCKCPEKGLCIKKLEDLIEKIQMQYNELKIIQLTSRGDEGKKKSVKKKV